ncbi:MAG: cobalamin-dependent protein [Desulfobacterales bacterium]|nr:cobalamin-dependent protein [Desulfobacterales bacterium]
MKIQLVYPNFIEARIHAEEVAAVPMGLYSVAAVLIEAGHEVSVFNWYDSPPDPDALKTHLVKTRPDLIGFSILCANRWGGIDIARRVNEWVPGIRIVFGGVGATFLWTHLLTHFPEIDFVVVGEGETSFPALVQALENGHPSAIEEIAGIAFSKSGPPVFTGPAAPVPDLDRLPDPAQYFTFQHLSLTRGCPSDCNFCGSPRLWGRRVRFHSADFFVGQIARLYEKGVRFFYFSDDTFTLKKSLVIDVCQKIVERKLDISWNAISRVDAVDGQILSAMRRAGCIQISYGIESGSEKIRKRLGKSLDEKKIETAFALTTSFGILPRAYFIYGCPGDSEATVDQTLALMEKIKPLAAIFYILDIFPGTALYDDYLVRTGAGDDIWGERIEDILYFETDPDLSKEAVLAWGKQLREAFYQRLPEYARSVELVDDPEFFALHADFLSRLALTFDQGDYANISGMPEREKTAEDLYRRALSYAPDARAFLGLGMIFQRRSDFFSSIEILSRGLKDFPRNEPLHICLAVSLMNTGDFAKALGHLMPFEHNPQALSFAAACHRALGDEGAARACEKRL